MSIYKPDIEVAKDRWNDFWKGQNSRPILATVIPKAGKKPIEKPPFASGHDGNFGPVLDQLEGWAETHEFIGEAIPSFYLEFAADHFSALLGADLTFPGKDGGWPVHFVKDWKETNLAFQRDGKWWQRTVAFAEAIKGRFGDNLMITAPTLVANLDALVATRGVNDLLLDLVDEPDLVKRALDQVLRAHAEILEAFEDLFEFKRLGSINRHGLYSRGRINVPQCDISCMLSAEMFREFVLPSLQVEMERLDAVEYHLDGPGALRHLETLCAIEKLDLIQWVAGSKAGNEDWSALHAQIDTLGKGQFHWGTPDFVIQCARKFRSKKLFFYLSVGSRQEFDDCAGALEEVWRRS